MSTLDSKRTARACIFNKLDNSSAFLEWVALAKQRKHRQRGLILVSAYFVNDERLDLRGPKWLSEQDIVDMNSRETDGILKVVRSYDSRNQVVVLGLVYFMDKKAGKMICSQASSFVDSISVASRVEVGTPPVRPCSPIVEAYA